MGRPRMTFATVALIVWSNLSILVSGVGDGDLCVLNGMSSVLVDDKLFFMGGSNTFSASGRGHYPDLYWMNIDESLPVNSHIPSSQLRSQEIPSYMSGALRMALGVGGPGPRALGALFTANNRLYTYAGSDDPTYVLSSYHISASSWSNIDVEGGPYNDRNATDGAYVSVPSSGLSFYLGGRPPIGETMLRFNASDPENPSWTYESLGDGSYGTEVPNTGQGNMVYIPAGPEGMLIVFRGYEISTFLANSSYALTSDMSQIAVYDIASHTWWRQTASGDVPTAFGRAAAEASIAPDGSAFHITTFETEQRAYILSVPSFTWINVTSVVFPSSPEPELTDLSIRRSLSRSALWNNAEMILIGGEVWDGPKVVDGACVDDYPLLRVLDLSTLQFRTDFDVDPTYTVPEAVVAVLGGDSSGSATKTAPDSGFADPTLSSLLLQRATTTSPSTTSQTGSSNAGRKEQSRSSNTGAIAGGVVGGVVGVALIAGMIWWLLHSRRKKQQSHAIPGGSDHIAEKREFKSELSANETSELHGIGRAKPELDDTGRQRWELEERVLRHEMDSKRPAAELPGR